MATDDMSDEAHAKFGELDAELVRLCATPQGAAFVAFAKKTLEAAAQDVVKFAEVVGPIALEGAEKVAISIATSALEKELSKLQK